MTLFAHPKHPSKSQLCGAIVMANIVRNLMIKDIQTETNKKRFSNETFICKRKNFILKFPKEFVKRIQRNKSQIGIYKHKKR